MVQITVLVRPLPGYNAPKKTKTITVDTSDRVEAIMTELKLDKRGTRFFDGKGRELPLNSSLASNNVRDGDVLEGCAAPKLSAALSAVLHDLNAVEKLDELDRTEERLRPILDVDGDKRDLLEPFPDRWSKDELKNRIIALATMKKIIQRIDRFEDQQVPFMDTLQALHDFVQPILQRSSNGRGYNSILHAVKPTSRNRDGLPTTCWVLLQQKLDQMNSIAATLGPGQDVIEEFLKNDCARREKDTGHGTPGSATPAARGRSGGTPRSTPGGRTKRVRRNLQLEAATNNNSQSNPSCTSCSSAADSVCLEADCPFRNQLCCFVCFTSNHPLLIRNHTRVDLATDPRAKRVLKEVTPPVYIPEFASGPFAILATLTEMSTEREDAEHSLTESRLKKLSQIRCRSNLYDAQAQGARNAFTAAENLADKSFLRKEIIPGVQNSEARFSLMPTGEAMGKLCLAFERGLKTALYRRSMLRQRSLALSQSKLGSYIGGSQKTIQLIIDNREDSNYINRLTELLSENKINYDRRELPTGDYLFTARDGDEEIVLPLVIERKTWSDLADSVMGRGQRRLDCVRIGSEVGNQCQGHRCQLCRMKRSGCTKLMFIVEGHRCLGRDGEEKCSSSGYCRYCKELVQRHGAEVVQINLEKNVIERLQCEHECIIHFTDGFNETISSLLTLHNILGTLQLSRDESTLTYQRFCTNSRNSSASSRPLAEHALNKGDCVVLPVEHYARQIFEGKGPSTILGSHGSSGSLDKKSKEQDNVIILEDSDDDSAVAKLSAKQPVKNDLIVVDIDSSDDDSDDVEVVSSLRPTTNRKCNVVDDDVVILNDLTPLPESTHPKGGKIARTGTSTKLVIISGLLEYDTEYKKDTNAVWKSLYKSHGLVSQDQKDLENAAAEKLRTLCNDDEASPLVPREFLTFWSLYLQVVNNNVRIHFSRETSGLESLRSSWQGRRQPNSSSAHISVNRTITGRERTPPRRILDFGDKQTDCMVCHDAILLKQDEYTTKCGHTFHIECLRNWFDTSRGRKCPHCNVDGIGLPKEADNQATSTSTPSGRKRKVAPPGENSRPPRIPVLQNPNRLPPASATNSAIREARLRRFQGGATASPSSRVNHLSLDSSHVQWDCMTCTLRNNEIDVSCQACGTQRLTQLSSNEYTQFCTPSATTEPSSESGSASRRLTSSISGGTRMIRCGACKQPGHNRSSATASNCSAFFDPEEVQMRQKKAEEAERKAKELREETKQREDAMRNQQIVEARRNEELKRLLEENQRKTAEVNRLQAAETKRLEKAAARAEKRARRLQENNM